MHSIKTNFKSGFIAIVGAPNVGKSTLLNRLLGEKISITSRKPQTTRNRILGIMHQENTQMIFLDTPGVHQAKSPLNARIVEAALTAMADVDLILLILDATSSDPISEKILLRAIKEKSLPVILVINKIDKIKKPHLLFMIDQWSGRYSFKEIIPISAKRGTQVDVLVQTMDRYMNHGPAYFPKESITDLPERFIVAEMVREKVFRQTGQEIPYAAAVTVDSFLEDEKTDLINIHATIHVEHDSQKGIIIGIKGNKLKRIGVDARKDIERILGTRVFLKLFVRVQKNWSKDTKALRKFGY